MEPFENFSLENMSETVNGVLYIEEWESIPTWENVYYVSSFGRIKSAERKWKSGRGTIRTKPETILKQTKKLNKGNYLKLSLCLDGRKETASVHRIVATVFCPNPDNLPIPNHLDSCPWNNRKWNLSWCSQKDNVAHSFEHGNRKEMNGINNMSAALNDEKVREIRKAYATGETTLTELGQKYGVGHATIRRVVVGITWKHVV